MMRLEAVQRCPVEKNEPCTATSIACSSCASSSTTSGFLPPISSWNLAPRLSAASAMRFPVATEPVKLIASMPGWSMIACPTTEPLPITRLKTPAGSPARLMMSASAQAQPGTRSAGLNTTQLP